MGSGDLCFPSDPIAIESGEVSRAVSRSDAVHWMFEIQVSTYLATLRHQS